VKGLEYEMAQLKSEKVSLQGEIDNLKNNVIEASVLASPLTLSLALLKLFLKLK